MWKNQDRGRLDLHPLVIKDTICCLIKESLSFPMQVEKAKRLNWPTTTMDSEQFVGRLDKKKQQVEGFMKNWIVVQASVQWKTLVNMLEEGEKSLHSFGQMSMAKKMTTFGDLPSLAGTG